MPEPKTKPTTESVPAFLKRATDGERRRDCAAIARMMQQASGAKGVMWGSAIVGFGLHDIPYADGRTAAWPVIAFSPRKQSLTLYINRRLDGLDGLLSKLGKHKLSGGCLHIRRLTDVDTAVLNKLITQSVKTTMAKSRQLARAVPLSEPCDIGWRDVDPTDVALIANAGNLSAYDASYLWLAGSLGADLVTLDARLVRLSRAVL